MRPWKLVEDPTGYIFRWLVAYSALLGAVGGILVADYFVIRRTQLQENLPLILENGKSMIVAQSADPIGDRQVTVEVKATVLR
jgi:cytosine/uracil/thiamine/allantoin permease